MAFTKIVSPGIDTTGSYTVQELNTVGIMTAGTVQVGAATTVHTTGIDLGSGNITSHNINSTGIITATSFVGPVTGAITGTATTATNAQGLTGSPSITVTDITASGNVSIGGTLTYEDVTNIDAVGVITARNGIHVSGGDVGIGVTNPTSFGPTLQVSGTDPALLLQDTATAVDYFGVNVTSGITQLWYDDAADFTINTATAISGPGLSEKLRITSGGQSKFTVGTNKYVKIYAAAHNDETDLGAGIAFSRPSDGADMLSGMFAHSNTGLGIAARDHITFLTGGTSNISDTEERLRVDSSGRLLINKNTNRDKYFNGTYSGQLQVEGTNDATRLTQFVHNQNSASQPILILGKSRGSSTGSYTIVQDGDFLGTLSFQGADGDEMVDGARIDGVVNGTPSNDNMPTDIVFKTNQAKERLRISNTGELSISGSRSGNNISDAILKFNIVNSNGDSKKAEIKAVKTSDISSELIFSTTVSHAFDERMRIADNGNIAVRNTDPSSKIHIGDLISSAVNDANTTHTSLIIKQTTNDNKSGFYIERSGERKGYYMWMNPGGGSGDGLTFTRNNAGTKSNALILDRDANIWGGGTFYPLSDNSYDLGSASNRWRNVYTTDLQLSNEGSQNDVDGTWGSYTIQEGEDELFLINRRNGKKYKINMTEVE